jgi:hypothetical protein
LFAWIRDPTKGLETLRLGVARYCRLDRGEPTRRAVFAFQSASDFWLWMIPKLRPRETTWLFAHGLGFDLRVIKWPEALDAGWLSLSIERPGKPTADGGTSPPRLEAGLCVFDGSPTILECWAPSGAKLRLVDTLNYWNKPLAKLGESIGLAKLEMPDPWDQDAAWLDYCARDCEILETSVLKLLHWHRTQDLGVFKPTAAGLAMHAFKHRFHSRRIVLHDEETVRQQEREVYYAGELATFYLGPIRRGDRGIDGSLFDKYRETAPRPTGPLHQLDVNSLFPACMADGFYPVRLLRWRDQPEYRHRDSPDLDQGFAARVLIDSTDQTYPARGKGRTYHCLGKFWTSLCGPELARAVRAGHIQAVDWWAEYELDQPFCGFVEHFWGERQRFRVAGDQASAELCKLILNSLYGKFAQHAYEWLNVPGELALSPWSHWTAVDIANKTIKEYRAIGGLTQLRQRAGDHPQAFIAISAWVTATARERMRRLREICGYHHVYYQAVDSLYVSPLGLERLQAAGEVNQDALGKLRLEYTADEADFLGCGYYRIGDRRVLSSIRKTARLIDSEVYEQDQFERLATAFASPPLGGVSVKRVVKQVKPVEPLGGVTENGWVKPLDAALCLSRPIEAETFCG